MAYGDGDGKITTDFTLALDVAGHEMTHGVISDAIRSHDGSQRGLYYYGESGALNEALADFFGEMIEDNQDWIIGNNLFLSSKNSKKGIRCLKNPGIRKYPYTDPLDQIKKRKPFPNHIVEKFKPTGPCNKKNDRCGVHINSTIIGYFMYLTYEEIGKEKTEKLFYTVLTQFLSTTSSFTDFAKAVRKACPLMGNGRRICSEVDGTLKQVGL